MKYGAETKYKKETLSKDNPKLHKWLGTIEESVSKTSIPQTSQKSQEKMSDREKTNTILSDRDNTRSSRANRFSYETLTSKPDMKVTLVDENIPASRADVVFYAKKNAASVGKRNKDGSVSVYVDDLSNDVLISTNSIKHSLDRRMEINAPVMLKIGEILKNSIRVNKLNPRENNIEETFAAIGVATNNQGEPYIVSFVINSFTNEVDSVNVLCSANAKTEPAGSLSPRVSTPATDSTISISDLLDYVNNPAEAAALLSAPYVLKRGKAKNGMIFYDINLEVDGKVPRANRTSLIKSSTSKDSISQTSQKSQEKMSDREKTNTILSDRDNIRSSRANRFSYETLTSKPDMKVTLVDENIPASRADVVFYAKKNAASVGKRNKDGSVSVYVDDLGNDVIISTNSVRHSLDRRMSVNAPVMLKIGEILKQSIKINELNPREENIKNTYALISIAKNNNNKPYIVLFVVNSFTNEIDSVDVLYSANAKKEPAALLPRLTDKSATFTDSTISISDLLDYVNKYFPDILPKDVLKHYGHTERPEGKLGKSALFSDRDFSYDELVAKDDLQGVVIDKNQQPKITNGIIDNNFVVKTVRNKCKSLTHKGGVVYYVDVPDIGTNVEIINDSITHGFARPNDRRNGKSTPNAITNARVMLEIPRILNNSIEVNRSQRGNNIDVPYTHVLIGTVALEDNGVLEYYAVRSMVQERKNQNPILVEANVLGKLTSVNAKKIGSPTVQDDENIVALADGKAYAYRIADLLNDVKNIFDNTFSKDVYHHFGMARKEDDFSKNLLFSERDPYTSNRHILANALEGAAKNDIEKNKLAQYKEKISQIETEEKRLSEIQKQLFTKGGVEPENRKELQFEASYSNPKVKPKNAAHKGVKYWYKFRNEIVFDDVPFSVTFNI